MTNVEKRLEELAEYLNDGNELEMKYSELFEIAEQQVAEVTRLRDGIQDTMDTGSSRTWHPSLKTLLNPGDQLTRRQQLCEDLYHAGMKWDRAEVASLLQKLRELDKEFATPDFDLPANVPKVGDLIYLPTRGSIDHGYDDVWGGVGMVKEIKQGISAGVPASFVTAHEQPGRGHNWEFLGPEQTKLKQDYGNGWARPDPDLG